MHIRHQTDVTSNSSRQVRSAINVNEYVVKVNITVTQQNNTNVLTEPSISKQNLNFT